jgi:cell division protein FtsB
VRTANSHSQAQAAPSTSPDEQKSTVLQRPRRVTRRLPTSKVRWDRKFRMIMVTVFVLVGWIGVKAGTALVSAHSQAHHELSLVTKLSDSNHKLEARSRQLSEKSWIIQAARGLGMIKVGERPYVIVKSR